MGPQSLTALHRLQSVETRLRGMKEQLRRKGRVISHHTARIKQSEDQLLERHEEIKKRRAQVSQLELDFKTREVNLGKIRAQLNTSKNNKEYSALLTQLNTERADNSKLEEKILEELTEIDKIKSSLEEAEKALGAQKNETAELEKEFEAFRSELQQQIDSLENEHDSVAQEVSPTELAVFQRVADAHEGEAMAKIVKPNPHEEEYICDGCNMSIPMEKVNALLTRDEIQLCNICGRILFLESEASDAAKR